MIKVAHIETIYRGTVGVFEAKLVALDSYDDLDVTVITAPPPKDLNLPFSTVWQISTPIARTIGPLADLSGLWKMYRLLFRENFNIAHTLSQVGMRDGAIMCWKLPATVFLLWV